ncbi:MAG: 5'-nucleotidase [Clostridium sp.]|nr:5'-nucleotidase [Acetatifactor muris]MCM1526805.1 5'-nucleotidase [Bacteroides sp.]MCM1562994.1 5'-nucleotidase [Clostridium sp.]
MVKGTQSKMVIGISARALFDLTKEHQIYLTRGVEAYCKYQMEHEREALRPGPGFGLIRALLSLNSRCKEQPVEVIIMSHNSPDTSLRVFNTIRHYGLDITRAVLVSGASLAPYLEAFHTDLYLSACEEDVQCAIDSGIAAGIICTERTGSFGTEEATEADDRIRIAFDGDAVLFTDESERIFRTGGLHAFVENEEKNADNPLADGPFANFLRKLASLQRAVDDGEGVCPIRTALVTSRSAPAHERVIRTLRSWNVRVDEAFFLGGLEKREVLAAFGAQIFFDDQSVHTQSAAQAVPAARVPYRKTGRRDNLLNEISDDRAS